VAGWLPILVASYDMGYGGTILIPRSQHGWHYILSEVFLRHFEVSGSGGLVVRIQGRYPKDSGSFSISATNVGKTNYRCSSIMTVHLKTREKQSPGT